ncbi:MULTISPECIES: hypothetical protein [unclassified Mesorhizobium]|uniref:hypothetical protein n=1 Tax=unclassified Mesorhizobium TaxID=325217 RepID=UPI000F74F5C1|nr:MULTISPECIES: hypothetical protein [unclassified Mesorhizobium]AZO30829.1 hypothetical protein EJ071_27820 [Mesorhizobium sp. M1B.F.Ca.ET.045.04.1.1]RWD97231.1 MAG: hypothetical protein EOS40_29425 [Mesorhizobium sp.]
MGKGLIAAVLVAALGGCTMAKGGFCAVSSPLRLSAKAVETLSDEEARALLAHNRKGAKLCGWRP